MNFKGMLTKGKGKEKGKEKEKEEKAKAKWHALGRANFNQELENDWPVKFQFWLKFDGVHAAAWPPKL